MQIDTIKPKLKLPRTQRSKLKCDEPLSTSALKFNLRRYNADNITSVQLEVHDRASDDYILTDKCSASLKAGKYLYTRPRFCST